MYIITEPYDGLRVRILACARTKLKAEKQFQREVRIRTERGYCFFSPVRRIIGTRREVDNALDIMLDKFETWDE